MSDGTMTSTVIGKLLDWPFLFFILILAVFVRFRAEIALRIKSVTKLEFGNFKADFTIGDRVVSFDQLDSTITARLRDLQEQIEGLRGPVLKSAEIDAPRTADERQEIPPTEDFLIKQVYPMLESNLWRARFVMTLADAASVTEQMMLTFLRNRGDIGVFKRDGRWAAALKERLKPDGTLG